MKTIFRYAALAALALSGVSAYASPDSPSEGYDLKQVQTKPQDEKKVQDKSYSEGFPFYIDKEALAAQMEAFREQIRESFENSKEYWDSLKEGFSISKDHYLAQIPKISDEAMEALRDQIEDARADFEELRERVFTERGWDLNGDDEFSYSDGQAPAPTVTKDYNLRNFTGISASGIFKVEVSKGPFSVSVECTETIAPYVKVRVVGNSLVLGLENMPNSVSRRLKGDTVLKAYVSMPKLSNVKLSGASGIILNDHFDLGGDVFYCELSGASSAKGVRVSSRKANLDMSGASNGDFMLDCDSFSTSMSGASVAKFDVVADGVTIEVSGASKASGKVDTDNLSLESSGSSLTDLSGRARRMTVEGSGVSKFSLSSLECGKASAELSGSSTARMDVADELKVELSGASSLLYNGNRGLSLDVESVSRASTLKKY